MIYLVKMEKDIPQHRPKLIRDVQAWSRNLEQNWYAESFDHRNKLMSGHAKVGRTYAGRVLQLITGSTGLDDMEWGVTLLAKSASEIKAIVYEMRFDEVSAQYAEFGEFFIGLQLPLDALYERLCL